METKCKDHYFVGPKHKNTEPLRHGFLFEVFRGNAHVHLSSDKCNEAEFSQSLPPGLIPNHGSICETPVPELPIVIRP